MTATTEELLRLARKAWPDKLSRSCPIATDSVGVSLYDYHCSALADVRHGKAHEGVHVLLLVLAGELDLAALQAQNAALLAERDRLQRDAQAKYLRGLLDGVEDASSTWNRRDEIESEIAKLEEP